MGLSENYWEYRSFKDQGIDLIPQIHLGEKASALERAGIRTVRGDINREIIAHNAVIAKAKAAYNEAVTTLKELAAIPVEAIKAVTNELLETIRAVAKRNKGRLSLPIIKGEYIRAVSNRAALQDKETMERFVHDEGLSSFADLKAFKQKLLDNPKPGDAFKLAAIEVLEYNRRDLNRMLENERLSKTKPHDRITER